MYLNLIFAKICIENEKTKTRVTMRHGCEKLK